jgi:hypothetical protein
MQRVLKNLLVNRITTITEVLETSTVLEQCCRHCEREFNRPISRPGRVST